MKNTAEGLLHHSVLSLAAESVLNYAGYNKSAAALKVSSNELYISHVMRKPGNCFNLKLFIFIDKLHFF